MLNKIKKVSIKWRLFFYLLLFAAATLILLWLFQVVFLDNFYKNIKIGEIKSISERLAKNISSSNRDLIVKQVAQSSEACITIADKNGNPLYTANFIPDNKAANMTASDYSEFFKKAKSNGGSVLTWMNNIENQPKLPQQDETPPKLPDDSSKIMPPLKAGQPQSVVYTVLASQKDGSQLAVIFYAHITPVDATVTTIRTQLLYVTAIMLLLALILAFFISARVSKPIIKINRSAKELAGGNYNIEFDVNSYKEITELGETLNYATSELQKTESLRRELIANISHDLRTPLTMITGYAEVMRDLPGETTKENIQIIIDESKHLTALVNDVLDISKLQSGTQKLNLSEFNLTESIKDILKRYQKLTEQGGYLIKFLFDHEVMVYADELRISQVTYNLVNNAVNYTGSDKTVIVRQNSSEGKVKIEVIDTGSGIPEDQLPLIWDRYFKAGKGKNRIKVGTGLGLSIVKAILDQHHALYAVNSTVGQGSIFWFELKTL